MTTVEWSIGEVARAGGVTTRTLRHYDEIGLLRPARVAADGRRFYREPELLRLQRILLLRATGLGLPRIAEVLDAERDLDAVSALRGHRAELERRRRYLSALTDAVDRTISLLEKEIPVDAETLFQPFAENPYEDEARERWGDAAVDAADAAAARLDPQEQARVVAEFEAVHTGMAEWCSAGAAVTDPAVQGLVARHHAVVSLFWTPDAAAYRGLGEMYLQDERFRATIGRGNDAVVEFLCAAMAVFAESLPAGGQSAG